MANVAQSNWTGTRGIVESVLPDDWDEAAMELKERCAHCSRLSISPDIPPAVAIRVWDFFKKEFPGEASALVELYLDS